MYRRPVRSRARSGGSPNDSMSGFKAAVIKQTAVCIVILVALIGVKTYDGEEAAFIKNTVVSAVNQTTDFPGLWDRAVNFFRSLGSGNLTENNADPLTTMTAPVNAPVTSPFGMRMHPVDKVEKFHYGVDIGGKTGDKIRAANSGEVAETGSDDSNGNYIILKHSDNIYTFYGHCEKTLPVKGDRVKAGQVIATMGETGKTAGGANLHFEIREGDNSLDPQAYIKFEAGEGQ